MATLNYTTTIAAEKTVAEVQAMLVKHGAHAIMVRYANETPVGLSFQLDTVHGLRGFTLPVDIAAVHRLLVVQKQRGELPSLRLGKATMEQHAAHVAWRVLKDWLAAQLAIIEAQMVSIDQVMLPYLHAQGERTLYEVFQESEQRALMSGGSA